MQKQSRFYFLREHHFEKDRQISIVSNFAKLCFDMFQFGIDWIIVNFLFVIKKVFNFLTLIEIDLELLSTFGYKPFTFL